MGIERKNDAKDSGFAASTAEREQMSRVRLSGRNLEPANIVDADGNGETTRRERTDGNEVTERKLKPMVRAKKKNC